MGTAHVGAFGPVEAEPAEVLDRGGREFRPAARAVEVFDPQHEPRAAGAGGREGEGPRMSGVQESGRRRRETAAESHGYRSHQLPVAST